MAKRRPTGQQDNRQSLDKNAFWIEDADGRVERAVYDSDVFDKLDQIYGAVSGAQNTTVTITNFVAINSGQEYNIALPANTKTFIIKSRDKGQLRLAYALGGTNSAYLTIPVGASFEDKQFYTAVTIYFQTTKPGDTIEVVAYS